MHSFPRPITRALLTLLLFTATHLDAANITTQWTPVGTAPFLMTNSANWNPTDSGTAPINDSTQFLTQAGPTGYTTVTLNAGLTINDITFLSGGPSFTFDINNTLTITAGATPQILGVVNNSSSAQIFNVGNTGTGQIIFQSNASTNAGSITNSVTYNVGNGAQSGTLTFTGASGATTGTGNGLIVMSSTGLMQIQGTSVGVRIGSLSGVVGSSVTIASGSELAFGIAGSNLTFAGVISGNGGIFKEGTGTEIMTGINTYSGGTEVSAGTISMQGTGVLNPTGALTVDSGGTFDISSATGPTFTVGDLNGAGTITLGPNTLVTGTTTLTPVFSGVISGSGGLTKQNSGTLTLSGANLYSGTTSIIGGILVLGGTNTIQSSLQVNIGPSGELQQTTFDNIINNLTGSGTIDLGMTNTLTVNETTNTTYSGTITDSGMLSVSGTNTLTLTGANTNTGLVTVISSATLALSGSGSFTNTTPVTVNGGATFDISNVTGPTTVTIGNLNGAGTVTLGSNTLSTNTTGPALFSGNIQGAGGYTMAGSGNETLSGTNLYTGPTLVSSGTLTLGGTNTIQDSSSVTVNTGASLVQTTFNNTINNLSGSGSVDLGTSPATLTVVETIPTTFSGVISDTGNLTIAGTNTLTLTGINTFTGAATINSGATLALAGNGALSPMGAVAVLTGGTFDISGVNFPNNPVTIGDLSGGGLVILGANTLAEGTANSTVFSGMITGTGGFIKQGTGTLKLTGTNNYTGNTELAQGTLELTNPNTIGSGNSLIVTGIGTLQLDNPMTIVQPITIDYAAQLTVNINTPNTSTLSGNITGGGDLVKTGTATLILTGTNSYTGGTAILGGALQGNTNAIQGDILDNASLIFDQDIASGTFFGNISGSGSVTKQNTGTVILKGINSYTGGTFVNAGTLQGDTNSLQGNIVDNATLVFDQAFDGVFNGVISGSGIIVKQNIGRLTFDTDQSAFTGQTNVTNGTLAIYDPLGGNVDVYGPAILTGTGPILGNLHMHNGSIIAPRHRFDFGAATFTVDGNLILDTGSLYFCRANSLPSADLIAVGGTAQINGNLFVDFIGPFNLGSACVEILSAAGGRIGLFVNVETNNPALVTPMLQYTNTGVFLCWTQNITSVAFTHNQQQVAAQLDCITNPAGDELLLLNEIVNLSPEFARFALDSLSGDQYTYFTPLNKYSNERFNQRIFYNVQEVINPCWKPCDGDLVKPWFVVEKGEVFALGDDEATAMEATPVDLTLGAHIPFSKGFIVGGAVNYESAEVHFHKQGYANWNIWQGSVYAVLQQPMGYLFLDAMAGSSFGEVKRRIRFALIDRVAKGKPTTHQGYLYTEAGINFEYCHVLFQPYFAGEFGHYKQKSFTETGADAANLTVNAKTTNTVDTYLGFHIRTSIAECIFFGGSLAWHHCYGINRYDVVNQFSFCNPMSIIGSEVGQDAVQGSVYIDIPVCDWFSLYAEVAGERWGGWGAYSADVGISTWW